MNADKKVESKASPALSGKFEIVGVNPGVVFTKKFGDVDLRTISLDMAEKLVKNGFRYLKKIESKVSKESTEIKK
jgi:hypothetical protein